MKIRLELSPDSEEFEVIIKAPRMTSEVEQVHQMLVNLHQEPILFYKDTSEYFVSLEDILFFETEGNKIFAHSHEDSYEVKLKLYELEKCLPRIFCRISKSTIANTRAIYSLDKSFSGTSRIRFYQTHKQVHVSRHYYQLLKERLNETR